MGLSKQNYHKINVAIFCDTAPCSPYEPTFRRNVDPRDGSGKFIRNVGSQTTTLDIP
jgi:hypothetical protein